MKTIIVYATKYGVTEKCAKMLSEQLTEKADLCNIKTMKGIELNQYDQVIIGGSIYMGRIQKEVKDFCTNHLNQLKEKRIGLFICCMQSGEGAEKELKDAFPDELFQIAVDRQNFGGEIIYKQMGFFDRFITKMVAKSSDHQGMPSLDENRNGSFLKVENIKALAQKMNK